MHIVKGEKAMLKSNEITVYKGCLGGCMYCEGRNAKLDFEFENVEIIENVATLLSKELEDKKPCMLKFNNLFDPYQALESKYELTRKCLTVIMEKGFGGYLTTKSSLVTRDIDILKKINEKSKFVVVLEISTYNEKLCNLLEEHTSTVEDRFKAARLLTSNGIPTIIKLSPFLPYINDNEENLNHLLEECKNANVTAIIYEGAGIALKSRCKEYYFKMLDKKYPTLTSMYKTRFQNKPLASRPEMDERFDNIVVKFCEENKIMYDLDEINLYLEKLKLGYTQLNLFN